MSMRESFPEARVADDPRRLSDRAVASLFAALRQCYGSEFDRKWAPPAGADAGLHAQALMDRWALVLGGFRSSSIRWALDNLPRMVPNLPEFRDLCNRAPLPEQQLLPAPKVDPQRVAQILARLKDPPRNAYPGSLGWAQRLRDREVAGEVMSRAAKRLWRSALGVGERASAEEAM